ncbi:helix-turn-helix domain-containing protein [Hymenobacter sp. DH14]|uniref:Helix-turn-helix domain-containing protein n=1 Tax=Hymenobacter cyanobacteriorum TaxID=2926463 RepID=A0A9X2AFH5_9BACT|nr:helix-turn-helix domain-containing protein [Hymenobacter cyanobacteriorum]MCI1187867.1 helix-turn-helix domain-containing protein [Hymenobacter cyanobacteriorum]
MLRIIYPDGSIAEAEGAESEQHLLDDASKRQAYTVKGLANRLNISERGAYDLVRNGEIRYVCAGKKNYRISELAVREYMGDIKS